MGTFKDSLKKWFYTQGTQAASSDARVPLLDASGNPIGSDTMANLASVLGASNLSTTTLIPKFGKRITRRDANDLIETGWYYLYDGNNQNSPDDYFFMHTINYGALDVIQYGVGLVSSEMWVRAYTGTWSSWHKLSHDIPSFYKNYSDLSSLANALGVGQTNVSLQSGSSLDIDGVGLLLLDANSGESTALYIRSYWVIKLILFAGSDPKNIYTIAHTAAMTTTVTALTATNLIYKFLRLF